ncbi:hypothetical protein GOV03_03745 [Candidatus Woesearchaeota archaeon]|nr:hypothetical protein [Candidatus Woesearchaeota archaeon]
MKKRLVFLIGMVLLASLVLGNGDLIGKEKHLKLLAVQENGEEFKGSIADLYLELNEGSGRVFLETFPLTKMDTQISTRFAKEMACDYFDLDCGRYDFIYTIKAKSNIIGGPSAGAAIAALTAMTVLDLDYNDRIVITGTINSGGIVGPVGGVKEKLEAASENGLNKVLLYMGGGSLKEGNETQNLIEFAEENLSLEAVEVENLNDVLWHFTGKRLKEDQVAWEISPDYQEIMKGLSDLLCSRMEELGKELDQFDLEDSELEDIEEKKEGAINSTLKKDHYSAASLCFGANILINELIYDQENKSSGWVIQQINNLRKKVNAMEDEVKQEKIETISDLQTLMIVNERLNEVKEKMEEFKESEDRHYALSYMEERFFSAITWKTFFEMDGKTFVLNKEKLRNSCMKKISESEERYQYVSLLLNGFGVDYIKDKVDLAKESLDTEDYDLCLMKATQAKAEANTILSSLGVDDDNFMKFWESKKKAVENIIAENGGEGVFPILGFSYYQYANTLKETDQYTALLYLEYALEMSDIGMYFEEEKTALWETLDELNASKWSTGLKGFMAGFLFAVVLLVGRKIYKRRFAKR